jgi:hypothetical protein
MYRYTNVPTTIYYWFIIDPKFKAFGENRNKHKNYSIINNCNCNMDIYTPKCTVPLYLEHIKYNIDDDTKRRNIYIIICKNQ